MRQILQETSNVGSDESAEVAYRIDQSHGGAGDGHRHCRGRGRPEGIVVGQGSGDCCVYAISYSAAVRPALRARSIPRAFRCAGRFSA